MNTITLLTAFIAGLGSFFAPCVLPLLPAYVGYVTGFSINKSPARVFYSAVLYILGFSIVFVLLGVAAGGLGSLLREYTRVVQLFGGLAMVIFGLQFIGVLNIQFLAFQTNPKLPSWTNNFDYLRSFLIGVLFAVTWTPCVGAVLGGILSLAATSASSMEGGLLLLFYSLGISIPFVIIALTLSSAPKYLKFLKEYLMLISKLAGVILVIFGVLLITDTYKYLNSFLFDIAFQLGWEIR